MRDFRVSAGNKTSNKPKDREREKAPLYEHRHFKGIKEWATWITVVAGGILVVLGLVTWVFPNLKPQQPEKRETISATLSNIKMEPRVPLREYAKRTGYR